MTKTTKSHLTFRIPANWRRPHLWRAWLISLGALALLFGLVQLGSNWGWTAVATPARVEPVAVDSQGNVWAATFGHELFRRDPSGDVQTYTPENSQLPSNYISALAVDAQGRLWVATQNKDVGIFGLDGSWTGYPIQSVDGYALAMAFGQDGDLWVGTGAGLAQRNAEGKWTLYTGSVLARHPGGDRMEGVAVDPSGRIWVAALEGVGYLDRERRWTTVATGIENAQALAIAPDGRLWIPTLDMLLVINERGGIEARYTAANSVVAFRVADVKFTATGRLWLSAGGQLKSLDTRRVLPPALLVLIGAVRVFVYAGLVVWFLAGLALAVSRSATTARTAPASRSWRAPFGIWVRWVSANLWAHALGLTASAVMYFLLPEFAIRSALILLLPGMLFGAITAVAQWGVMRRYLPRSGWWLLVTLLGGLVGFSLLQYTPTVTLGFAVLGMLFGIGQWLVLRPCGLRVLIWPISSAGAWAAAGFIFAWGFVTDTPTIPGMLVTGACVGLVAGALSGIVLAWVLRDSTVGEAMTLTSETNNP